MLSLVLRGKLSVTEDVLTAVVFDAIAAARDLVLVRALVDGSRGLHGPLAVAPFDDMAIELWPRTNAGEPDVRIRLFAEGALVGTVIVEAKLWAPKSGDGVVDDGAGDDGLQVRDQLARYLLDEHRRDPRSVLIYLTHHAVQPQEDLHDSIACLQQAGGTSLTDSIYWMSWRALERDITRRIGEGAPYTGVRQVLHRARMYWFAGIAVGDSLELAGGPAFYRAAPISYVWPTQPLATGLEWHYRPDFGGGTASAANREWASAPRALGTSHFYETRNS